MIDLEKILSENDFDLLCSIINHEFEIDDLFRKVNKNKKTYTRKYPYPDARFVLIKLLTFIYDRPTTIGRKINLDHASVLNAIKKFDNLIETDKVFLNKYQKILEQIRVMKFNSNITNSIKLENLISELKNDVLATLNKIKFIEDKIQIYKLNKENNEF